MSASLEAVKLGELATEARVTLRLTGDKPTPEVAIAVAEVDLPHLRDAALTLASDQALVKRYVTRLHNGKLRDLSLSAEAEDDRDHFSLSVLRGGVRLVNGSAQVPTLEREVTDVAGRAELRDGVLTIRDVTARLGASELRDSGVDVVFQEPRRLERAHGDASLVLEDLLPDLRRRQPFARFLGAIPAVRGVAQVAARNGSMQFRNPTRLAYDLAIRPRHIRVAPKDLPAAVDVDAGQVRLTAESMAAEQVRVSLLDSTATVSGEVTGLKGRPVVTARVTDGVAQRNLIDWLWRRAHLPKRLRPATPLIFAASHVQWSDDGLEVVAAGNIDSGVALSLDLRKSGGALSVRRATIKDRDSDASLVYSKRGSVIRHGLFRGAGHPNPGAHVWGFDWEFPGTSQRRFSRDPGPRATRALCGAGNLDGGPH